MKGFTLRMIFVSGLRITQGKRGWNDLLEHLEKLFKVSPFSSDVSPRFSRVYLFKMSIFTPSFY